MDRRAIGSSLLALAFGPVALGAIALGAAIAVPGPVSIAAPSDTHRDSARLTARDAGAADELTESAAERVVAVLGPPARVDGRPLHAPLVFETFDRVALGDAALILSFAPKTSPPS